VGIFVDGRIDACENAPFPLHVNQPGSPQLFTGFPVALTAAS
jgi:hypothetical protein